MPADVVLDLELCGNDPLITRELARLQGFVLLPMELGEGDVARALAEVAKDCGKTLSDALTALGGGLTLAETDLLIGDLCDLSNAVGLALGVLQNRGLAQRGPQKRRQDNAS